MSSSGFEELGAHPALARALAAKGYEAPTNVQAEVLDAEHADRDLLVSSATGSGKTVAFGLLIARTLLGEAEKLEKLGKPRALVIAPTRELATQVKKELAWLFHDTGARIASFTGGTDLRQDARALHTGVEIVVGTPGRLVDLLERKSLDLSTVEAVVLDEADEMLDLGFRESLEAILERAPKERRTFLFSATLPREIRALAQKYQESPLSVDPRTQPAAAHEDITHVCHLVAVGDKLAAIVNVLRDGDEERSIIFCSTREGVAELHRELTLRGFRAVAISGERAQAERNRALEMLRKGEAQVLVATNVAARGLDLPDVGLVVHADLPENAEALTHRSGRTGRAGRKGVNVIIATVGERRRAERLFAMAHLKLGWTHPPSAASIAARDRERFIVALTAEAAEPAEGPAGEVAERLLAELDPKQVVAALARRAMATLPAGELLKEVDLQPKRHASTHTHTGRVSAPEGKPRSTLAREGVVLFRVNLGAKDKAEPGWLLPLVCRRGAVTRKEVGAIRVERDHTMFEIVASAAAEFAANAGEKDPRAPHVRIERAEATARLGAAPSSHDRGGPKKSVHPMRKGKTFKR